MKGFPFPHRASKENLYEILEQIQGIVENSDQFAEFQFCEMEKLSKNDLQLLMERRLISLEFTKQSYNRAVMFDKPGRSSIMINEEDHFRLQLIDSGMKLESLWSLIQSLEQTFEDKLNFAFTEDDFLSDKYGYRITYFGFDAFACFRNGRKIKVIISDF